MCCATYWLSSLSVSHQFCSKLYSWFVWALRSFQKILIEWRKWSKWISKAATAFWKLRNKLSQCAKFDQIWGSLTRQWMRNLINQNLNLFISIRKCYWQVGLELLGDLAAASATGLEFMYLIFLCGFEKPNHRTVLLPGESQGWGSGGLPSMG